MTVLEDAVVLRRLLEPLFLRRFLESFGDVKAGNISTFSVHDDIKESEGMLEEADCSESDILRALCSEGDCGVAKLGSDCPR